MALRKFKKAMVPLSVLFIIAMLIPLLIGGRGLFSGKAENNGGKKVIAEVNGYKIYNYDFESQLQGMSQQIDQMKEMKAQQGIKEASDTEIPQEVIKRAVLDNLISRKLLLSGAKDLKIKASEKDLNEQLDAIKKNVPKDESFLSFLQSRGIANEKELKEKLKEDFELKKVLNEIQKSYKITDEELKKYYSVYQYAEFQDQTFEEAKPAMEELIRKEYSELIINSFIEKQRSKTKIDFKDDEMKKLYAESDKAIVEKDGYKFRAGMLDTRVLTMVLTTGNPYSQGLVDQLKQGLQNDLNNLVAIGKEAKTKGLTPSAEFTGIDELRDLGKKYFFYLVESYKVSDQELKKIYDASNGRYDIKHSVGGYVVGGFYDPTEGDIEAAKKKAEELAKTLTPENFAENARKLSEDPGSKANGGDLGWIDSNTNFVPEFLEAVKSGEKGKIVGPIQSEFGFHIIYIEDRDPQNPDRSKVSHILILPKASAQAKTDLVAKLQSLKKDLEENKVKWTDVIDQDKYKFVVKEVFKKVYENSAIPGIGFSEDANKKLFAAKLNEILEYEVKDGYFLMVKNNEIQFKSRSFEEVKDRIRNEEAIKYASEELDKIK